MHTTRLYNTLIQHVQRALIQHEFCTTRLYNTLIQHANRKIKSFQKSGKDKVKERKFHTTQNPCNTKNTT